MVVTFEQLGPDLYCCCCGPTQSACKAKIFGTMGQKNKQAVAQGAG